MTNTNDSNKFLSILEQAEEILSDVEALKLQIRSYKASADDLGESAKALNVLSTEVVAAVEGLKQAAESLKEIGTAQILEGQESIISTIDTTSADTAMELQKIAERQESAIGIVDSNFSATTEELQKIKNTIDVVMNHTQMVKTIRTICIASSTVLFVTIILGIAFSIT